MKTRIITAIVLIAIVAPLAYLGGIWFCLLGVALSSIASYEMISMLYTKSPALKYYRILLPIFSGIICFLVSLAINGEGIIGSIASSNKNLYFYWMIVVYLFMNVIILACLIFTTDSTGYDIMGTIMTLFYTGLIMGFCFGIRNIDNAIIELSGGIKINFSGDHGITLAYLYGVVCFTDTFAYFFGMKFGKHKLAPAISPKKSVEGAIAGLVFGSVLSTLIAALFMIEFNGASFAQSAIVVWITFMVSVVLSCFVQIGDLVASKLKRTFEIKDYGKIFPGHGGVLDRFDSFTFGGACFFVIIEMIILLTLGV